MCYLGKIKWAQSKPFKNTFGYQMVLSHEIQFIGFEIVLNLAESSLESLTSSRIWAGPEFAQPVRRQAVKGHRLSLLQKSTPPTTFQLVMGLTSSTPCLQVGNFFFWLQLAKASWCCNHQWDFMYSTVPLCPENTSTLKLSTACGS